MRKGYEKPQAELLLLGCEDVMTESPGITIGTGSGNEGGGISFNDWLNQLNNGGIGGSDSSFDADVGDLLQ